MIPGLSSTSYSQPESAQVTILGVYHFDNPNQDYVKTNVDDHLSANRQKQIAEVVEMLAQFKPTKIVLEAVDGVSPINRNYDAYLKGDYVLKADERDQLGLRLAKMLGHKQVYSADNKLDMDFGSVIEAAQQSKDSHFLQEFQQVMAELQTFEKRKATMTVREILSVMNDPKEIGRGRDLYLQMAAVRSGEKFVGADVLAGWYQRNFRIFSNIVRIIQPQDRVLVIFGQGHAGILRDLVRSSRRLELVEASAYLVRR
jgi:hypothetical protein